MRALPALRVALAATLWAAAGCGPHPASAPAAAPGAGLFADPFAVEVLAEARTLAGPISPRPNRFFGGWIPDRVHRIPRAGGHRVLRTAPGGATIQVVVVEPGAKTLALDLARPRGVPRPGHVEVRLDDGPARLVPVTDPLLVALPGDLAPGRHQVRLSPHGSGSPPVFTIAGGIRGAAAGGGAHVEDGDLVQTAPSMIDVVAPPGPARRLTGTLCPPGGFGAEPRFSVRVVAAGGAVLARWPEHEGAVGRLLASVGARLGRCRAVALSVPPSAVPIRVRLAAHGKGGTGRWRGWRWHAEAASPVAGPAAPQGRSATSAASTPEPRNPPRLVILYVMDALRADRVGALGGPPGVSPTYDRLAREGFLFRAHHSVAPNTLPSTRDLFTGRVFLDESSWRSVGMRLPTLAEAFRDAGYRTGLFSGNGYVSAHFGLARGFEHVSKAALFDPLRRGPDGSQPVNRNAAQVHRAALAWLATLPRGARAFLYLHTIHPHNPYAPPPAFARRFTAGIPSSIDGSTRTLLAIQSGRRPTSPADRDRLRGLYAASLAYEDSELARLLDALRKRYPPRETFVVLTADHGDELFDHGGALHGATLYEELLHIPLVVWAPGRVRPGETRQLTDALDLHATLLDLVGEAPKAPGGSKNRGRSLLPLLTGRESLLAPRLHFAGAPNGPGGFAEVRDGRWKLIRVAGSRHGWSMGRGPGRSWDRDYLFDLATDPKEHRNLAGTGGVEEQWLRARLRAWVHERKSAGGSSAEPVPALDEATRKQLEALGYVE